MLDLSAFELVALSLFFSAAVTLACGGIIFFANLNKDVPNLDNPARYGWNLIVLAGFLTAVAVSLSIVISII